VSPSNALWSMNLTNRVHSLQPSVYVSVEEDGPEVVVYPLLAEAGHWSEL